MNPGVIDLPPLVLAGGPPRSGTTLLARLLNAHPRVCTVINNNVFESDVLFSYTSDRGLIQAIRRDDITSSTQALDFLTTRIVEVGAHGELACIDVAPSSSTKGFPFRDTRPSTVALPLEFMREHGLRLCLKSPMVVDELHNLDRLLPRTRFVLSYRHPLEIAESMYHIAETRWYSSFHRDWTRRERETEDFRPPVHPDFDPLWSDATGFQRCLIYAVSYLRKLLSLCSAPWRSNLMIYDYADLMRDHASVLRVVARHLELEPEGFDNAGDLIQLTMRPVAGDIRSQYEALEGLIGAQDTYEDLRSLVVAGKGGISGAAV